MTAEQADCVIELLTGILSCLQRLDGMGILFLSGVMAFIVVYVAYYILIRFTYF